MFASISCPFSCHWKLYIVPSLLWMLQDLSFILTVLCQSVFMLCWANARHLPKCECPFLKGLCLPLCVWETISDSEQWSWLKSGHAAVVYVPMSVCLSVCFCVCHHTRVVTVAKDLGGVAFRSVLMPLSLHGLFPFSQLPSAPSKRWWVGGIWGGWNQSSILEGWPLSPGGVQTSEQVPRMQESWDQRNNFKYILIWELTEPFLAPFDITLSTCT